jgi:CheY-like chemotaxis protein
MQVLDNLLDNAARFTENGTIGIEVCEKQNQAQIRVRDTGSGIDSMETEKLFEPYFQTSRGDSGAGSLGFGLALVKGIVEMHGGRVEAHSEGPGKGSEFIVALPLAASEQPRVDESAADATPQRRILVVDDNRDSADMFAALLEAMGQDVRVAYSGGSALDIAEEMRPQIAFLDVSMPGMDGRELARRLREQFTEEQLTMIALTGFASKDVPAPEFAHHLLKPATSEAVVSYLSKCC